MERLARSFAALTSQGRTKAALCLGYRHSTDVVDVSSTNQRVVKEILAEKYPPTSPALAYFIVDANPQAAHPAVSNDLDAKCITVAALHTEGEAGPSGIDARGWRRLCCSFGSASELCKALASIARHL